MRRAQGRCWSRGHQAESALLRLCASWKRHCGESQAGRAQQVPLMTQRSRRGRCPESGIDWNPARGEGALCKSATRRSWLVSATGRRFLHPASLFTLLLLSPAPSLRLAPVAAAAAACSFGGRRSAIYWLYSRLFKFHEKKAAFHLSRALQQLLSF